MNSAEEVTDVDAQAASAAGERTSSARWRMLLAIARPYRRKFVLVTVFALLATATDLLSPVIYREAVNDIAGLFVGVPGNTAMDRLLARRAGAAPPAESAGGAPSIDGKTHAGALREPHRRGYVAPRTMRQALRTLLLAVSLLFAINVFSHFCSLVADQRTVRLASRIEADVIQRAFRHVLQLPLRYFSRQSSGSIAKQIDQSDEIAPIVTAATQEIAPEVIRMIGVIAIMSSQSWRLTLAALLLLPPYAWIVLRSTRRLETGLADYYDTWDGVSAEIQDALGAVKTVKLAGAEAREAERLQRRSNQAYETYVKRNRLANVYLFWQTTLNYLSQAMVLGYGGWLVFEHQLTPGDVVMFVAFLDKLYSPIETLTGLAITLQEHFASFTRATRLLGEPAERSSGATLPGGAGRIEFRNVTFSYVPGRPVLRDVSFTLHPGHVTALVGPSGAGKTTAADLLLKLFAPESGEILLDGAALSTLDAASVRAAIAVVAADGAIFRGSLLENIRYMRPEATESEVLEAARAAGLHALLQRLPQGLQTPVGEHGVGLSVGERQRLQIARALAARPRVLVLDEATANLDFATEKEIRAAVLLRTDRPTTLVIAHRWSMVEHAEHVVVLDAGRIVDQGTPAELIGRGGWFARFAAASATGPESEAKRPGAIPGQPAADAAAPVAPT